MFTLPDQVITIIDALEQRPIFIDSYEVTTCGRVYMKSSSCALSITLSMLDNSGVRVEVAGSHLRISTKSVGSCDAIILCLMRLCQEVLLTDELACA